MNFNESEAMVIECQAENLRKALGPGIMEPLKMVRLNFSLN